jgi:hypothetical protein
MPTRALQDSLEGFNCLRLGIRDALTIRAIGQLTATWLVAVIVWLVVFVIYYDQIYGYALGVAAIFIYGLAIGFPAIFAKSAGLAGGGLGMAIAAIGSLGLGWIIVAASFVTVVLLTVRVFSELLLMKAIRRNVSLQYDLYPNDSRPGIKKLATISTLEVGPWLLLAASPSVLIFPLIGPVLFFLLISYLNARFLINDATEGLLNASQTNDLVKGRKISILTIGAVCTILGFIPILGVLSTWILGSSVCHLAFRRHHIASLKANALEAS